VAPKIRLGLAAEIHEHEVSAPMRRRNPAPLKEPVMVSGDVPAVGKVAPNVGFCTSTSSLHRVRDARLQIVTLARCVDSIFVLHLGTSRLPRTQREG